MKESDVHSWLVEWRCPQCGAPVVLEETDRILSCGYCRVRLHLSWRGHWRYWLSPGKDLPADPLFVPYWRFRGIVFSCVDREIRHRVADSSHLALGLEGLPATLGFRPQALKLRPVTPTVGASFLRPETSFRSPSTVAGDAEKRSAAGDGKPPAPYEVFIGETVSVLYSPVTIRGEKVLDGILGRPLPSVVPSSLESLPFDRFPDELVTFSPMLCPRCGWDLEGEKDSVVLLCRNCRSAWASRGSGLERVDFSVMVEPKEAPLYLPFWQIRARFSGIRLDSYADLVRLANLPKAVQPEWEDRKARLWIPAFKIAPHLFLRLGRALTLFQGEGDPEAPLPSSGLHPVSLPPEEAAESLVITVAAFGVPKKTLLPKLPEIRAPMEGYSLCYVPFRVTSAECIQPKIGLSLNRNALDLGRKI
ncbi:MAG TPA: hypothetical protein PLM79_17200 [Syntrophobacteraceae bacterium]|nr:hypothetical protein [Syntrophobacteraceae bacterium]